MGPLCGGGQWIEPIQKYDNPDNGDITNNSDKVTFHTTKLATKHLAQRHACIIGSIQNPANIGNYWTLFLEELRYFNPVKYEI